MSNSASNDALSALGLDIGGAVVNDQVLAASATDAGAPSDIVDGATVADTAVNGTDATAPIAEKAKREEVKIDRVEFGEIDFIPTTTRGGATGSKYQFSKLTAPRDKGDGSFGYSNFKVFAAEGEDENKVTRSVQSATTQENRKALLAGSTAYHVTRVINDADGKFDYIAVIRTDARPEKEEAEETAAS